MKFEEIAKILKAKNLVTVAAKAGKDCDINGFRTKKDEDDAEHKLRIVRPLKSENGQLLADEENELWDSCSFMIPWGLYSPGLIQKLIDSTLNKLPFQLLIVTDLDAAEKVLKECFETQSDERFVYHVKTLEEIATVPKDRWIEDHDKEGHCCFCGKELPMYYGPDVQQEHCDCAIGKAVAEHNRYVHLLVDRPVRLLI